MSGRLLTVVSGKGGVGKSFVSAAIGARWAAEGKRVVLLDMNLGMRYLDMLFGLESRVGYDLSDVVFARCGLNTAMVEDRRTGLRLISAPQFTDGTPLNENVLRILLEVLCSQHDVVLLDAPGGLADGFRVAANMAQTTLLVSTPDDMALRDAERTAMILRELGKPSPLLVVNRLREGFVQEGLQYTPEVCAQLLDMWLLAAIPEDDEAYRLALMREPALEDTRAGAAIQSLMARLDDENVPLRDWHMPQRAALDTVPEKAAVDEPPTPANTQQQRGLRAWLRRLFR